MEAFLERDKENTGKHLSYKLSQSSQVDDDDDDDETFI